MPPKIRNVPCRVCENWINIDNAQSLKDFNAPFGTWFYCSKHKDSIAADQEKADIRPLFKCQICNKFWPKIEMVLIPNKFNKFQHDGICPKHQFDSSILPKAFADLENLEHNYEFLDYLESVFRHREARKQIL